MNKTETRYALILEARKRLGEIVGYEFGSVTLRLGDDCRYTPDFFVWSWALNPGAECDSTVMELHEVKGTFMRDDARVKLHAAAKQYPCFQFRLCRFEKGSWTILPVQP